MSAPPAPVLLLLATATAAAAGLVLLRRRRRRCDWTAVGTLTALNLYPLKSGAGVPLRRGRVTRLGLRAAGGALDRSLAVVCEGRVLAASARRRLVLVSADVGVREVTLTAPGMTPLMVRLPQDGDDVQLTRVDLNGHPDSGVVLGPEAARWLGEFFADGKSYTLLFFLPSAVTPRRTSQLPKPFAHLAHPEDSLTYNFATPLSVLCESSLTELNRRLNSPVTTDRFRHNLIIGGAPAFDDDSWTEIRVGDALLRRVKAVQRCGVTLVDPGTGERSAEMEPLRTLRQFRLAQTAEERSWYKEAPLFGSDLAVDGEGEVEVGDVVYVRRK